MAGVGSGVEVWEYEGMGVLKISVGSKNFSRSQSKLPQQQQLAAASRVAAAISVASVRCIVSP